MKSMLNASLRLQCLRTAPYYRSRKLDNAAAHHPNLQGLPQFLAPFPPFPCLHPRPCSLKRCVALSLFFPKQARSCPLTPSHPIKCFFGVGVRRTFVAPFSNFGHLQPGSLGLSKIWHPREVAIAIWTSGSDRCLLQTQSYLAFTN